MASNKKAEIKEPRGKLGCLCVGLGAVTTTFIGGIELIKKGLGKPIGSLTQMGTVRLGKRTEKRFVPVKELVPLASIDDIEFLAWDVIGDNAYQSALKAEVLSREHIEAVREELAAITPRKAVFDKRFVKNLDGDNVKQGKNLMELSEQLYQDIVEFQKERGIDRMVMIWSASTEVYTRPSTVHSTLANFERGLVENHPEISPSMVYAYTALKHGIPFVMGAPNTSIDIPALMELANKNRVPIAGKDYKTGQTLMKTIIAPGLKARLLGVRGWFSTNILGNRDGLVLDDPESFRTKEVSKLGVLDTILQPDVYPDLYGDLYHKVRINYYPPRGDDKEGWDNIDIFGWLNYPMQIKINFLCKDSILASPLVLDLLLFMDMAQRAGLYGIQEWLSFYFKSPIVGEGLYPEHDLFIQLAKLKNTLRYLAGEELITHLGVEYYEGMSLDRE